MVDVVVPVMTTKQQVVTQRTITAANTSSGDSITYGASTSLVVLKNYVGSSWQYDVEYKVDSGAWTSLPIKTSQSLDIDLSTQTLKVRKLSPFAPTTVVLDLEILTAPTGLFSEPSDSIGSLTSAQAAAVANFLNGGGTFGSGSITATDNTISLVGDSRLDFSRGTNNSSYGMSPILWANDLLCAGGGTGFDQVLISALAGDTLATSVSSGRMGVWLANAGGAKIGVIWFGANDLNPANAAPLSLLDFLAQLAIYTDLGLAVFEHVFVFGCSPLTGSLKPSYLSGQYQYYAADAGMRVLCAARPRAHFVDFLSTMIDPASATQDAFTGLIQQDSGDFIHQQTKGGQYMGYALAKQYGALLNLVQAKTKGANLLPSFLNITGGAQNGTFVCTTEAVLGTDWEIALVAGTGTATSVTVTTNGNGSTGQQWKRIAVDNSAQANEVTFYVRPIAAAKTAIGALLTNGDMVQGEFEFMAHTQTAGSSGTNDAYGYVRLNNSGTYQVFMGSQPTNEETRVTPSIGYHGVRRSRRLTLGAAPTAGEVVMAIQVAANGAMTVDLRLPKLYKLT